MAGRQSSNPDHAGGRTQVEVKQTQAKAILSWSSFNVGRETDLYFNQTAGGADVANWIALNRVTDSSLAPSRILGSIKAEGQVYIINRNGIIFGGSGQVNVHTLIASSLSLDNDQFLSGINVQRKINSGADNYYGLPTFGDHATEAPNKWVSLTHAAQVAPAPIGDPPADVIVEAGALIDTQTGGKAMLFAPHVANAGTIRAPDGQVILAAGEQVWLLPPKSVYANPVRGFDVAVSAASPYLLEYPQVANVTTEGAVTSAFHIAVQTILLPAQDQRAAAVGYKTINTGVIEAERGNITVQAREVVQNGALYASTALGNRDGSIVLRAWGQGLAAFYTADETWNNVLYSWSPGTLTIGAGSVTTVMPDIKDAGTIEIGALNERYRAGKVDLRGYLINIESDASIVVPSGAITAVASSKAFAASKPLDYPPEDPGDGSRIYIDNDAILSVAGLQDILLAMESNVVKAELRINELRELGAVPRLMAARRNDLCRQAQKRRFRRWPDVRGRLGRWLCRRVGGHAARRRQRLGGNGRDHLDGTIDQGRHDHAEVGRRHCRPGGLGPRRIGWLGPLCRWLDPDDEAVGCGWPHL